MATPALRRWILVNYSGYPYAPNSLMPDNGLANLAGALQAAGGEATILDYATVGTLAALNTPELTRELARVWERVIRPLSSTSSRFVRLRTVLALGRAESHRRRLQRRLLAQIGDELVRRVRRDHVQAVGFKLWNGDGLTGSVTLARRIRRECPGIRVFGGGPHVDMFGPWLLPRYPIFDALAYGEGEETIVRLAEDGAEARHYAHLPNLWYLEGRRAIRTEPRMVERLDDLPSPVYDPEVYPALSGEDKIRIFVLDESRGCRNHCAFCIHPVKSHRTLRLRRLERLWAEIERLQRAGRTFAFRFAGSSTPFHLLNSFAMEACRRQRPLLYSSFAHVRGGEEADFVTLRKSGCVALFFGVESGSQRILDRMCKGITIDQIERTILRCREAGVAAVCSLIYPAPGEDEMSRQETLALIGRVRPDGVTVQPAGVLPGTPWFQDPAAYGIAFSNRDHYVRRAMVWKAKLLLPPALWRSLPVRVNGRPWREILRSTGEMVRDIEAAGIPCALSDDLILMSACAGMDPVAFRDEARRAFFTGDIEGVRRLVNRMHRTLGSTASSTEAGPRKWERTAGQPN